MRFYFLKVLSSFAGALIGTLAFVATYFLSLIVIPGGSFNPTNSIVIIFMIFAGSSLNNILSNLFISYSDPVKYQRIRLSILQTFNLNLFLFLISLPFYFIFTSVQVIAICYIVISAFASFVLLESFARGGNFILTGIYGSVSALLLISITFFQLFLGLSDFTYIFFFIMPIINMMFIICILFSEYVARELYSTFGTNFFDLSSKE